jgi:hypothetical protein
MSDLSQQRLKLLSIGAAAIAAGIPGRAIAAEFTHQEVEQAQFIAIASPYGDKAHQLLIVEQIPGKRQCWKETGETLITVDPLLVQFDFKGHCKRYTDANGYSVRVGGQDLDLVEHLTIKRRDGELWLEADPVVGQKGTPIIIGRTNGDTDGFAKIVLNPGWRFARRTYKGKPVGHVYLVHDASLEQLAGTQPPATGQTPALAAPDTPPTAVPMSAPPTAAPLNVKPVSAPAPAAPSSPGVVVPTVPASSPAPAGTQ